MIVFMKMSTAASMNFSKIKIKIKIHKTTIKKERRRKKMIASLQKFMTRRRSGSILFKCVMCKFASFQTHII